MLMFVRGEASRFSPWVSKCDLSGCVVSVETKLQRQTFELSLWADSSCQVYGCLVAVGQVTDSLWTEYDIKEKANGRLVVILS